MSVLPNQRNITNHHGVFFLVPMSHRKRQPCFMEIDEDFLCKMHFTQNRNTCLRCSGIVAQHNMFLPRKLILLIKNNVWMAIMLILRFTYDGKGYDWFHHPLSHLFICNFNPIYNLIYYLNTFISVYLYIDVCYIQGTSCIYIYILPNIYIDICRYIYIYPHIFICLYLHSTNLNIYIPTFIYIYM
jgi:hypothetical protein